VCTDRRLLALTLTLALAHTLALTLTLALAHTLALTLTLALALTLAPISGFIVRREGEIICKTAGKKFGCRGEETAARLERFQNSRAPGRSVKGGVYFHPTDEDPSVGTPDRKTPLGIQAPVYSNSGTAVMGWRQSYDFRYIRTGERRLPAISGRVWRETLRCK
jgi:hypothetical protein